MKRRTYDVAVIGSGTAGTTVATAVRKGGRSVVVIDDRPLGGTCALRGCDPKKIFVAAARAVADAQRWHRIGVMPAVPTLDWARLQAFKRTFTDPVPEQRAKTYDDAGIERIAGRARFVGERALDVDGERIEAASIVIATGARERRVASGDDALLTSDDFLNLEALPESLIFVGAGYIAFEFAHVAARGGSRVTIVHDNDRPLPEFDADAVDRLVAATREAGIEVRLNAPVHGVRTVDGGIAAVTDAGTFRAAHGVLSAGRVAAIDELALEAAKVDRTEKGIRVNAHLQSASNPHVYAAGDCADGGGMPLTPTAALEGSVVAANILDGKMRTADLRGLASICFAIPPLASVGLSQEQANERGLDVEVRDGDTSEWYSTRHLAAKTGYYKVVTAKPSGAILGATILGPHAEEQVNVLSLAIRHALSGNDLEEALFAYPTGSSDFEYFFS